jgi:hypothetical protein
MLIGYKDNLSFPFRNLHFPKGSIAYLKTDGRANRVESLDTGSPGVNADEIVLFVVHHFKYV